MKRAICLLTALCALLGPGIASAAAAPISSDDTAGPITALDGTVVWASGKAYKHQTLMQYSGGAVTAVAGAKADTGYSSIDLGRDSKNRPVLTYLRCDRGSSVCKAYRNDLHGHQSAITGLATTRCRVNTAPAYWRGNVAYGQSCTKPSSKQDDNKHTGLYSKLSGKTPRQMHRPKDAVKFGVDRVSHVDLRGTLVAAVVSDIYEYAFTQTLSGASMSSFLISASEGDSDEHVRGMELGSGSRMWTLVDAEHAGDPNQAILGAAKGGCYAYESMDTPSEAPFAATNVAVDGASVYLVVPGTGIVAHDFAPTRTC